ncbi:alpha/beta hydrolase [Variovorax sp. PCZ-1]|uniref:alpha/beta fold hydrolase n=1 Tax=Variovorax sp. PCZ-1 TaxID=2835533 RepID=UPI001BCABD84|nr:alpha/beta hydrolase [Variovorax sp. PCZ-1]MBS7806791.1 alpha/beta hydrolase [Variovorax sp. PCZ-1]
MIKILLSISLIMVLTGCASPSTEQKTQPIYDSYITQFNSEQPNQAQMLARPDGYRLYVREFGTVNKGKAPSIVMMHGFPDNGHLYDALVPQLSGQFHVITFDFLGWGQSDKPAAHLYNVASQRADLDAVVSQLGLKSVVPMLHDLSGQAGIDWALDNEAQTAALVLLNTYYSPMPTLKAPEAIQFFSTPSLLQRAAVWGSMKSGTNFQGGVADQLSKFFSNSQARDKYLPIVTHGAIHIRPAFFSSTSVLWQELEARQANVQRMQKFKKPVHTIFGADDPYLNSDVAVEFNRLFTVGSLHLLSGAGHYVQLDEPAQVGRILREQLKAR